MSSIGLGTYRGPHDEETDELYRQAVVRAVKSGCNVIDTAINYRHQRSERNIGEALKNLDEKGFGRDQIIVATKGGFVPFDAYPPSNPRDHLEKTYYDAGILAPSEVVGDCHAMTPRFLENQLDRSLANLAVETVDIYYIHNPETQLAEVDRHEFMKRLRAAFGFLESAADAGKIHFYGVATWSAFRQPPRATDYLSLEETVETARDIGGDDHRFRFIQLPYSLASTEALSNQNQTVQDNAVSCMVAADALGLHVMSSVSIGQGRLTSGLPDWLGKLLRGCETDVQRAIQFARSTPGITTALVGMKQPEHIEENLTVAKSPPTPIEDFLKLFEVDNR
jgi:aryl-alcohol dehydrogenase-like predicted oxidoreductase